MKNYIQPGNNLTVPAPAAVLSCEGVIVGEIFGIASGNAAINEPVDIATLGVFSMAKVPANVFALGAKVYFDPATKLATSVVASNKYIGVATEAVGAGNVPVSVRLNGSF